MYRTIEMSGSLYSVEMDEDAYEDEMEQIAQFVSEGNQIIITEEIPEGAELVIRD